MDSPRTPRQIASALRLYFEDGPSTFRGLLEYLDMDYAEAQGEGWLDFNNAVVAWEDRIRAERAPITEWECGSESDGHRCSRPRGHKGMHRKRSMLGPTQEALHAAYNAGASAARLQSTDPSLSPEVGES